ncbi:GroES-like protein, partial [Pluteus cervinus]
MASTQDIPPTATDDATPTGTMRSLHITQYTTPSNYQVSSSVPIPTLSNPTDVLIRSHAASINPGDVKMATGAFHIMHASTFPAKLGLDISGTIVSIHPSLHEQPNKCPWKVGDDVYTSLPVTRAGSASEYAVVDVNRLARKPKNLSHVEAASLPAVFNSALEMTRRAEAVFSSPAFPSDSGSERVKGIGMADKPNPFLAGKTVFVSGGLSGTGSATIQLAKHIYGASKVITSVSTSKISLIDTLLPPGSVDQVIDYQVNPDPSKVVGNGQVDVYFDCVQTVMQSGHLAMLKPGGRGVVSSITSAPRGEEMEKLLRAPWFVKRVMDVAFWWNSLKVYWFYGGIHWEVVLAAVTPREEGGEYGLDMIAKWMEQGKIRPVVGRSEKLSNLAKVIEACQVIESGKGGVGKRGHGGDVDGPEEPLESDSATGLFSFTPRSRLIRTFIVAMGNDAVGYQYQRIQHLSATNTLDRSSHDGAQRESDYAHWVSVRYARSEIPDPIPVASLLLEDLPS